MFTQLHGNFHGNFHFHRNLIGLGAMYLQKVFLFIMYLLNMGVLLTIYKIVGFIFFFFSYKRTGALI